MDNAEHLRGVRRRGAPGAPYLHVIDGAAGADVDRVTPFPPATVHGSRSRLDTARSVGRLAMAAGAFLRAPGRLTTPSDDQLDTAPVERADAISVIADDGIRLHAEVDGDRDAEVTVVFCHGFTMSSQSWRAQRLALGRQARVVVWDQRGHGRSERGLPHQTSIGQLGRDLFAVLDQVVPEGPVVLVGHSMGGMTIMALAEQHPELFGERVVGTALITTSAGPIGGLFGLPGLGADLLHWTTSRLRSRLEGTPLSVIAHFLRSLRTNDRSAALPVLGRVPCLVIAAENDVVTPPADSVAIAHAVPGAGLVVIPAAAHAVIVHHPTLVNECLSALLDEIVPCEEDATQRAAG